MGKLLDAVQGKKEAVPTLQKQGGSLYEAVKKIQQAPPTPQPQTISQSPFINIPEAANWTKKQPMSIAPKDTSKIDAAIEAAKKAKENADFLNSALGIGLQTIMGLPAAAKKILLEIPAQEGGGAVLQLTGQKEMQPQTPVEKFILGNEPVKPLGEQGKEFLQGFGVSEKTSEKLGLPVGIAMLTLDAWPGGGKTGLAKTLAKTKNASVVENILKRAGVADDLASNYSGIIAKMNKEKDVLKALDSIENIQKSTATTRLAKPAEELGLGGTIEQPIKKKIDTEILPKSPEKISTSQTPILPEQTVQARKETLIAQKLNQSLPKEYNKNIDLAIDKTAKQIGEPPSLVKRVVNSLNETKTKLLENVQNTEERVRQLVETKGIKISDESNPYLKMTLYPGRVGYKMETAKKEVESIIKEMNKERITRKDISNFLLYRHAPERNAALGEKAAGITTKEAELRMKEILASEKGAKIQQLADRMQKLNNQTLDMLRESGVISNELYSKLRVKYKNHVPLNRIFEDTEDIGQALSGKGFDVRSTGIKRAFGSEREVSDIMANIIYNYEQAVLRSEKNIVDQATLAFARQNKDILGGLLDVIKPRAIGKTFEGRILMERTNDPKILPLFENGKPIWIKINDPNLAIALRGVGREKLGGLLNAVANFTRIYAGLATRFNPEFALPNKIRDLQESAVYLSAQNKVGFKAAAKMAARDSASVKDVIDYIAGKQTPGANLYREMKELGGTTGGFGLSTRKQTEMNLESMEKLVNSKTKTIATNLLEYIDNWNTIFEDSTRLSVYKQALEQGLSKKQAAAMAKEASINFNRMGKGGPVINALWMFSNASIQGTTKMIRSLKNPKVLGAVTMAIGGSVAAVNEFNDRMDKNWRDKVTKWDRLNGLPIVLPSSDGNFRYFTIPVSWGIKPIKVMSDYAYDAVSGEKFNAQQMISDTITAIVDAYNPVGGSDLASAIMPTVGDLPLEISRNRAWSGAKIRPDFDPNAPADIQYFSSLEETKTGQVAISITEFLQQKTGLAVSPADIKYAFEQIVGGAGRFGSKTVNLISGMTSGKPLPLDEYPMLSRFYRQRLPEEIGAGTQEAATVKKILGEQSRSRFKIQQEAETVYKNIKENPDQAMKKKLLSDAIKKNPSVAEKMVEIAKDESRGLTYNDRLIKQLGVENGERAKYILEKIKQMKTNDEKKKYIEELKSKGLLTDAVVKSMIELLKK